MTLEEMRQVHEAATGGEWVYEGGYVRRGKFFVADFTLTVDAKAAVMAHNKFAKLLAIAEAAMAVSVARWPQKQEDIDLDNALAALEES